MTNRKKILLAVAILSMVIVSFMGGQSFSKYTSQVKGEGNAEVAKWNFIVNGHEEIIQTIQLGSTFDNETLLDNKIAPGTKGAFKIDIDATGSEVGIQYDIKFTEKSQKPANLVFSYNNQVYKNLSELEVVLSDIIDATQENKKIEIPIQWEWKYESGNTEEEIKLQDVQDTADGKMLQNYTFDVIVTGTQVPPSE